MVVRELITRLGYEIDDAKLKGYNKQLTAVATKARDIGRTAAVAVSLPIIGLGAYFTKLASDSEEIDSKFAVVFGAVSDRSKQVASDLQENYGLSGASSKELLGDTGDLLTGFGFTGDASLKLSEKVNKLAVDLASFTNFSGGAKGASQALTKALLGERESVKSLGISILEEDVKKQIAIDRTNGLIFATERQAKASATLTIALSQSKNAIGAFARTSGGFADQTRIMRERFKDLGAELGKVLLPTLTKVVSLLSKVFLWISKLSPLTQKILVILAGIAALLPLLLWGAGSLALAIVSISQALGMLTAAATAASVSVWAFIAPFIIIPAIIAVSLAAIWLIADDITGFFKGKDSVTGDFLKAIKRFGEYLSGLWTDLKTTGLDFVRAFSSAIVAIFTGDFEGLRKQAEGWITYWKFVLQEFGLLNDNDFTSNLKTADPALLFGAGSAGIATAAAGTSDSQTPWNDNKTIIENMNVSFENPPENREEFFSMLEDDIRAGTNKQSGNTPARSRGTTGGF